jgi:hypothetical protein
MDETPKKRASYPYSAIARLEEKVDRLGEKVEILTE